MSANYDGNNIIYPTFTNNSNPSWQSTGAGVVDANAASTSSTDDQVGVNFNSSQRINQIVIQWEDCSSCWDGERGIGLGPIEFCTFGRDYDRDGVLDINDVDDDNDGIPDNYELCGNTPAPAIPSQTTIGVFIQFDNYPEDVNWELWNSSGTRVKTGGGYSSSYAGNTVEEYYTGRSMIIPLPLPMIFKTGYVVDSGQVIIK